MAQTTRRRSRNRSTRSSTRTRKATTGGPVTRTINYFGKAIAVLWESAKLSAEEKFAATETMALGQQIGSPAPRVPVSAATPATKPAAVTPRRRPSAATGATATGAPAAAANEFAWLPASVKIGDVTLDKRTLVRVYNAIGGTNMIDRSSLNWGPGRPMPDDRLAAAITALAQEGAIIVSGSQVAQVARQQPQQRAS